MITIRRFKSIDQQAVKGLVVGIMNAEFSDAKAAYPTQDIDEIQKTYGGLGEAFFVAQDGEHKIIGTVAIKKEDERVALLRRLFVAPTHRNQQLGIKLIDHALEFCYEVGYNEIIFKTTSQMRRAIDVCQKRGFIPRAKVQLGSIELCKYSLSLRNGVKNNSSSSSKKSSSKI